MRRRAVPRARNRREFLQTLSAAAALPLVAGVLPAAGQAPTPAAPATPPATPPPAAQPDPEAAAVADDARDLLAIVKRRFGARLDAAQLDLVRADLEDNLRSGNTLRKLPLANADEPAVAFRAVPGEA